MKMKTLAMLGLSVCILLEGTLSAFAENPSSDSETECEHQWKYTTETKNTCIDVTFQHKNADGTVETLVLCPVCGKEEKKSEWSDEKEVVLTEVSGTFSNFSGLKIRTGTLRDGMNVLLIGFYYPEETTTRTCERCKKVETVSHVDARLMASEVEASIELPKEVVENYDLMLINTDGTETKLDVSIGEKKAHLKLNMTPGTRLIHLVERK